MDLLLDLTGFEVGEELALKSLAFDPMHREHEMGGGMGMGGKPYTTGWAIPGRPTRAPRVWAMGKSSTSLGWW